MVGNSVKMVKIGTHVQFPSELNLVKFVHSDNPLKCEDNDTPYKYNLYAICAHTGSLQSGHYTAYTQHMGKGIIDIFTLTASDTGSSGDWYFYSDTRYKKSSLSEALNAKSEGYLLFYLQESNNK